MSKQLKKIANMSDEELFSFLTYDSQKADVFKISVYKIYFDFSHDAFGIHLSSALFAWSKGSN